MDIKTLSVEQLKALAYDEGVKIEQARANLQVLNEQIMVKTKEPNTDSTEEKNE